MIRRRWLAVVAVAVAGIAVSAPAMGSVAAWRSEVVTDVDGGMMRGIGDQAIARFQGVPYAAAPVGDLRWRGPQPVRPWSGVRDATRSGKACAQSVTGLPSDVTSEDCLYLNVNRPR